MKKILLFTFIAISAILTSCDKSSDSSNPANYDQQSLLAQNYAFIQDVYGDIFDLLCQATGDSALIASHVGNIAGATVVFDSINNKYVFTFPAKSTNGKTGEFTADLDGDFEDVGTVAKISFNNYKVNGNAVQGSNDITNRGKIGGKSTNLGPTITYSDSIYAQVIKGGETINVAAVFSVDWMLGDTLQVNDDQYWFSGTITGTINPNKWFQSVVNPSNKVLIVPLATCQWIQSGIITTTTHTLDANNNPLQSDIQIDFGTGCNNLVQITMLADGTILTFPM
ncbi:MAG: hypothetical protein ACOYO1_03125 [Bacteroidales bacterium]